MRLINFLKLNPKRSVNAQNIEESVYLRVNKGKFYLDKNGNVRNVVGNSIQLKLVHLPSITSRNCPVITVEFTFSRVCLTMKVTVRVKMADKKAMPCHLFSPGRREQTISRFCRYQAIIKMEKVR